MKAFAVVISGLLLASPAVAQATEGNSEANGQQQSSTASDQSRTESAEEGEGSERRVCRRVGDRTASLTAGRRVCMTAEQWRNARRRD